MSVTIFVVMKTEIFADEHSSKDTPVEAHYIDKVADSRAGHLARMPSNRGFVFSVQPLELHGSEAVAEFPGVNARVQVEESRKTPRRTRRMPREQVDYCESCGKSLMRMVGDHCPHCGTPQPYSKQKRS